MPKISALKQGQSDPALKENGVWHNITIPDVDEPFRLRLRSSASNAARTWDIKRYREQRNFYVDDKVPPIKVIDQNECDKLADVLLLEWDATDDDGTPVPCTKENILALMAQLPDVRHDAIEASKKKEAYRLAQVAAIVKNSEVPSPQTSVTGAGAP